MARNTTVPAVVFFHADADGCCSAALLVRALNREAVLVPVGEPSDLRKKPIPKDRAVVFLDLGTVTKEMVKETGGNAMVIDHHLGPRLPCVHINPTLDGGKAYPVSYLTYKLFGGPKRIAFAGCVGDWFLPGGVKGPIAKAYYGSGYGKTARAIDATCAILGERGAILCVRSLLRGKISGMMRKCLKTVTGEVNAAVGANLKTDGRLASLVFSSKHRIKSQVAQLLKTRYGRKIIFVGQLENGGRMKFSMREGAMRANLDAVVRKCLNGLRGGGGGHAKAVGGWVDKRDFDTFLDRLKREVN